VFFFSELDLSGLGAGPVDHADVFVCVADAMDVEKSGCDEGAGAGLGGGWTISE